jgi:hypothetical protein
MMDAILPPIFPPAPMTIAFTIAPLPVNPLAFGLYPLAFYLFIKVEPAFQTGSTVERGGFII